MGSNLRKYYGEVVDEMTLKTFSKVNKVARNGAKRQ